MKIDRETIILYVSLGFLTGVVSMYVAYQLRIIEKYEEENSIIVEKDEELEEDTTGIGDISGDEIQRFLADVKAKEGKSLDPPSAWEMMLDEE